MRKQTSTPATTAPESDHVVSEQCRALPTSSQSESP